MSLRLVVRSLRLAPLAAAGALLAACASAGGGKPSAPVNTLYSQLDLASRGYEIALQQSREGNLAASQLTLTQSLNQLKEAAARCGNIAGCDPQRFFSVFDHLLRLKDGDFGGDQDLDSDVDPAQAALPTGKTGAASLPQAQRSVTLLHG
ncbi:MAG TPA: lytic transglycosylase, partial [Rhodanobacter sp.]